jgi:hypothetical protein
MIVDADVHQKGKADQSILDPYKHVESFVPGREYPVRVCLVHAPAPRDEIEDTKNNKNDTKQYDELWLAHSDYSLQC